MKSTNVTELKASLSALLDLVKAGSPLVVTEHETPIAIIYPYANERSDATHDYSDLLRQGTLVAPKYKPSKNKRKCKPLDIGDHEDKLVGALAKDREGD